MEAAMSKLAEEAAFGKAETMQQQNSKDRLYKETMITQTITNSKLKDLLNPKKKWD